MRRIAFRVDEDDVVAFHLHVVEARLRFPLQVVTGTVAAALFWIVAHGTGRPPVAAVTAAVGAGAYRLVAPPLMRRLVARGVRRRLVAAGAGRLGPREMMLDTHSLIDRSSTGEARTSLGAIRGIERDADRTYIYVGRDLAYILPRRTVAEGDYEGFVAALTAAAPVARN